MRHQIEEVAHHLIWVWYQYAGKNIDGDIYLEHLCMSAGEGAADWLIQRGYAKETGHGCTLTEKGLSIMNQEY